MSLHGRRARQLHDTLFAGTQPSSSQPGSWGGSGKATGKSGKGQQQPPQQAKWDNAVSPAAPVKRQVEQPSADQAEAKRLKACCQVVVPLPFAFKHVCAACDRA